MDALYLDPRRVNEALVGRTCQCYTCETEGKFEDGFTWLAIAENDEGVRMGFLWFCSLACLTAKITEGHA